jgi:hypothetical protein
MTGIDIDAIAEKAALGALDDLISDGCGLAELIDTYGDPVVVSQLADSDWQKFSDGLANQLRTIRAALAANATEYAFGAPDAPYCTVQYRGARRWAVVRGRYNIDRTSLEWHFELRSSVRGEEWLDAHRFDLGEALRLAEQVTASRATKSGASS